MSARNLVVPQGILADWQGSKLHRDTEGDTETFNVLEVARRLSLSEDPHYGGRVIQSQQANGSGCFSENPQRSVRQPIRDDLVQVPRIQQPQRSKTISIGGLGRSRVTGLSTPANPGFYLESESPLSFPPKSKAAHNRLNVTNGDPPDSTDLRAYNDLEAYHISSDPPIFLAKSRSNGTTWPRSESTDEDLWRKLSFDSGTSTLGITRRASVLAESVVEKIGETVGGALRRTSVGLLYDKAKLRQAQLQRSTAVQFGFQYTCYFLIAAFVYFVFVGFPLWNGLVLTIYIIFEMKLILPVGTAIFLGIGFL